MVGTTHNYSSYSKNTCKSEGINWGNTAYNDNGFNLSVNGSIVKGVIGKNHEVFQFANKADATTFYSSVGKQYQKDFFGPF